jgi:Fic family protein
MSDFLDEQKKFKKNNHPIVVASWLHKNIAQIHPFIDGNGRTARLLMNLLLFQQGYPIVIIPPLLRVDYLDSLRAADKGNDEVFYLFISRLVIEAQKDYLRLIGE